MANIQLDALREALQVLISSDLPTDPKRMLIEVVMESLVLREAGVTQHASYVALNEWSPTELEILTTRLQGKVAKTWQQGDEALTYLARTLRRNAKDVRSKAIELGHGPSVDFQLAKAMLSRAEFDAGLK